MRIRLFSERGWSPVVREHAVMARGYYPYGYHND
jgi:hypothetical protein